MTGPIFGHYRILEKIGSGGMGEVYRATDERLARDVAIKVLSSSFIEGSYRLHRFELEARAAAALNHPNIVAIFDIDIKRSNGAPYIVSELLEGQTLRQRLLQGPLSVRQAAGYGLQIAKGLAAAHEKHIVHCNLKPENLFITREGCVKILDFGIAKLNSLESVEADSIEIPIEMMTTQTRSGPSLGTVCYRSPEQLRGKAADDRSDIFALGAILYEMVTGQRAFSGETDADTMIAVLKEDPPQTALDKQNVPSNFQQIIFHCLEKEPQKRFQSVRDLAFALSTVSTESNKQQVVLQSRASLLREKLSQKVLWIVAAGLLLAAGAYLGIRYGKRPAPIVYHRITFQRGTIYSARFSPDGKSIIYGAMWNGRPIKLYQTQGDSPVARPLKLPSADMLALSRNNELALAIDGTPIAREFVRDALAEAPLAGSAPREVMKEIFYADWSPKGDLAVSHEVQNQNYLEYPIGKVLYKPTGWVSDIRFSPDGKYIAFMNHPNPWDERGTVCVTDLAGRITTLTPKWKSEAGLAWTPNGKEIWFTALDYNSPDRSLWSVDLHGQIRKVLTIPGEVTLQDIAPDGRVLITVDDDRIAMEWTSRKSKEVRDLSWYDWSVDLDISKDGRWVLFQECSQPAGPNCAVAIRKTDGSPPIRLGDGYADQFSPDGKWVVAVYSGPHEHIVLYPVGPGEARNIFLPELQHIETSSTFFLPDGKHIVVRGNLPGQADRYFLVNLADRKPRAQLITQENEIGLPSPNGKYSLRYSGKVPTLISLDGKPSKPIPLPVLDNDDIPFGWSSDSKALFVFRNATLPLQIYRVGVFTGTRTHIRDITPTDRAGVTLIAGVLTTPNASEFVYSYYQLLTTLYVVTGLH